jgi:hypothetical protein
MLASVFRISSKFHPNAMEDEGMGLQWKASLFGGG